MKRGKERRGGGKKEGTESGRWLCRQLGVDWRKGGQEELVERVEGGGKKGRKKETRYTRDERTGEWTNRSRVDGWVST